MRGNRVTMLDDDEVRRRLGYHPATPATAPAYELNRSLAIVVAEVWNQALPPGREAALALTALQEALMWANAAVACNAGPEWTLPVVDVSTQLDEVLEQLEGPLHTRSISAGGGGPVDEGSGGDIGPSEGQIAPAEPGSAPAVPPAGLAATHLSPEAVQGLVERTGARGPADDIARRSR